MKNLVFTLFFTALTFIPLMGASADEWHKKFSGLNLPGVTIDEVTVISDSVFTLPGKNFYYTDLPPFLRVLLTSRPTDESAIGIEIWLPLSGWNGRFMGTGNGGGAGSINVWPLTVGIQRGFAIANTDMGTSPGVNEIVNYPEKWKDFGYRATHEMTVIGKVITTCFYNQTPSYSYFVGCSTGGQQALMEAQRYPEDYDGILAGAPANNRTHLHTQFLWNHMVANQDPECRFTHEQLNRIKELVLKTNVGKDGGAPEDNFLTDPRTAIINYEELTSFLSEKQIEVLKKIYQGPVNPVTGQRIYSPAPLGSELYGGGIDEQQEYTFTQHHFYPFFWTWGKEYDFSRFDFNKDMDKIDETLAPILNANNPDLTPFNNHGGKLLMYTGTNDAIVPFQDAMYYYERVVEHQGSLEETQRFFRYFIIPGMGHCGGGPGLNECAHTAAINVPLDKEHDMVTALMNWVEHDMVPEQIIVTRYHENPEQGIKMQRPVFPYPLFPKYTGGDYTLPSSYRAVERERANIPVPDAIYLK
ncbi:MAG: tannase/feruloyl esterase family alpha/beta hydrolase [Candidatus Azobacteroides sp.]|nr:tannase/feruloyl esterase family alpha/beta hydrolase [Candidatus Azobacteroides sp.]